jgi:hypothetical protein
MNSESTLVPAPQPVTDITQPQSKVARDGMRKILAWFLVMSTIALVLLISAIRSIRDLERAQRQLGAEYEKVHQFEETHPLTNSQNKNEFYRRLDGLVSAHFPPDTKSFILEVKLATSIVIIYVQAVFFICIWVKEHQTRRGIISTVRTDAGAI